MMPLGDDNSLRRSVPIITYLLIFVNVIVFLLELSGGEEFVMRWAFVPSRFLADPVSDFPTLFTAMFMHASWGHLIGNMVYLWIFGDNVEDLYGKAKYFFFYIICGLAATLAQLFFNSTTNLPNVGASGAIAGILGAYILHWPRGKINVMVGYSMSQLPALLVIGFWFVLQFVGGVGSLASTEETGGVAYMAHIGGFIAGFFIAMIFKATEVKKL